MIKNHFVSVENKFFLGNQELFITLGNTNNSLKEHEEKFFFPDIIMNLNNTLYNIKWRSRLGDRWESIVGSQGMLQLNENGADAVEILIPDSRTTDVGIYGLMRYRYKKWRVMFGGRYDRRDIQTYNTETFTNGYNGLNYSAGFAYMGHQSTVRFNASSGFRAPNASELLSDGVHHGSFRYEIGDTTLTTEKAVQLDASYALHFDDLEIIVNPFFNYMRDYIYIDRTDSVIDQFNVYQYNQANSAILYGTDFGFHYHPHKAHWLHLETSFSTVFAEDDNKNPLPLIPQTRMNSQLKFETDMEGTFEIQDVVLQYIYFFEQNRLGILETVTPAYGVLNAGINMKVNWEHPLFISAGVRNILNYEYIDHLSLLKDYGIPAPGINAYVSVRFEFAKQLSNHKNKKQ